MKTHGARFIALYKKDLFQLFSSPAVPFASLFLLLGSAVPFLILDAALSPSSYIFRQYLFRFPYLFVIVIPALTMTIRSDERTKDTRQILLSFPVPEMLLVLGKFSALLTVFASMLALTVPVLFFSVTADPGAVFSSYALLFLFGGAALALGQFLSTLFSSTVLPFTATAAILVVLNTCQMIPPAVRLPPWAELLCTRASFAWHFEAAARGILDSRDVFFYLLPEAALLYANALCLVQRKSVS